MFDVGDSLRSAQASAGQALRAAQLALARANAGTQTGRTSAAALAKTAQAALLRETLVEFERARFAAVKEAAK